MLAEKPNYSVTRMARLLEVSRSGFYAWINHKDILTQARKTRQFLDQRVQEVFDAHHGEYGAIRIHRELGAQGIDVNRKTVEKSLARQGLRACSKRRYRVKPQLTLSSARIDIPDLVNRHWDTGILNTVWVSDITYIKICGQWLYVCAIMDAASRRIIGVAIDTHHKATLVQDALWQAYTLRSHMITQYRPDHRVIFHADHGSQFTSQLIQSTCQELKINQSMGKVGVCWDNAMIESFWASVKTELVKRYTFTNIDQAKQAITDWIHHRYNHTRRHSSLNYQSPINYEKMIA